MLKLLADPETQPARPSFGGSALSARPRFRRVAAPSPALYVPPTTVLKPSLWWTVCCTLRMCLPAPLPRPAGVAPAALVAFCVKLLLWPVSAQVLVPYVAWAARTAGLLVGHSELRLTVEHPDGSLTDYGVVGRRLITTAGVEWLATAFNNTVEPEIMNYHGFGTGTTAESAAHTALVTELTTEYVSNSTRPTGSQSTSTNTYISVGSLAPDSGGTLAITEHGLFSQASTAGGTMLDRTVFTAVNVVASADTLQATYTLTLPSGW